MKDGAETGNFGEGERKTRHFPFSLSYSLPENCIISSIASPILSYIFFQKRPQKSNRISGFAYVQELTSYKGKSGGIEIGCRRHNMDRLF